MRPLDSTHPGWQWGPIRFMSSETDYTPPHDHEFCEITLIRGGKAIHQTADHEIEVEPPTVIIVPPRMVQYYDRLQSLKYTNVYFLTEWLVDDLSMWWAERGLVSLFLAPSLFRRPLLKTVPLFGLTADELPAVDRELEDLARELASDRPSLIFLRGSVLKLLTLLARAYATRKPTHQDMPFRNEVWIALEHVERILVQGEPLHVDALADQVGLSPKRFSSIFKEATGSGPTDYYQRRRVQRAARLLLDPDKSVTSVAHELGYCDSSHFTNIFKRYRRMTPRAYRQLYRFGESSVGSPQAERREDSSRIPAP